jgi:uracil-DNA glycosylase
VDPALILPVGRLAINLYFPARLSLKQIVGTQKQVDGRLIVPLPHPSGASRWHQDEANRQRVRLAVDLIGEHLAQIFPDGIQ